MAYILSFASNPLDGAFHSLNQLITVYIRGISHLFKTYCFITFKNQLEPSNFHIQPELGDVRVVST